MKSFLSKVKPFYSKVKSFLSKVSSFVAKVKVSFSHWIITKVGNWLLKNNPPRRAYLCHFDQIIDEIKPCDVLLIEGRNRISSVIQLITRSPWSHACIYIGKIQDYQDSPLKQTISQHYEGKWDEPLVIESEVGKGTIISPLSKYNEDHIRILRPHNLNEAEGLKVITYALSRLGMKYNIRHVLDLARFLFPWNLFPRRWRSSLFQHNALQPTEDICSSMIADAFHSIHFPILPLVTRDDAQNIELTQRNPRLFTPCDFDFSPYFDVIKYPIIKLDADVDLSQLPWKKGPSDSSNF